MLRTISQLTPVVGQSQIWLKHQLVRRSLYSVVGCYCGSYNDLSRLIKHQSKCFVFCLYNISRRELQQFSKTAVITCSEIKEEKMAPTRVILMSCGSYNPPTNMHLRMFGTYISFLIINIEPLRKYRYLQFLPNIIDKPCNT